MDSYQTLLAELAKAKNNKNNWYFVASVTERLKNDSAGSRQIGSLLRDASHACGYSMNTLRRILALKKFFDSIEGRLPELESIDANALSFPSLEVVMRLYQLDSAEGTKKLIEVVKGGISFRELREAYYEVVSENTNVASAHQLARLKMLSFNEAALNAVKSQSKDLFQFVTERKLSIKEPSDTFHLPVDAVARFQRDHAPFSAFEFFLLRDPENPKQVLEAMLHRILFYSSFFPRFWVIIASSTGKQRINTFDHILDTLNCRSIGIAVLPWGQEKAPSFSEYLQIVRRPTGDPIPDYQGKHEQISILRTELLQTKQ
jgi:hypothetical protein